MQFGYFKRNQTEQEKSTLSLPLHFYSLFCSMAVGARHCTLRFMELEMKCSLSSPPLYGRRSVHFSNSSLRYHQSCSLSMNGCQGDTTTPIGTIETPTLPAVSSPVLAMESLNSAISDMVKSEPPPYHSGIIRLEINPKI